MNAFAEKKENSDISDVDNIILLSSARRKAGYNIIKKAFDFVSSLAASILLIIPTAVISACIMITDPGTPFYFHTRVGQDGRPIKVLKFRSMKKNADRLEDMLTPEQLEEYRREYKLADDPRLIGYKKSGDSEKCFGGRLRMLSMDEIPQVFYNILIKGNMSVVGPRPIMRDELDKNYTKSEREELLSVKPGLTGYWQAFARNNATYDSGERQEMELYYVRNRSVALDIKILLHTIGAVLEKTGAK